MRGVDTEIIPDHPDKLSKLVRLCDYYIYEADIYSYRQNGTMTGEERFVGTVTVKEPHETFLDVEYKY